MKSLNGIMIFGIAMIPGLIYGAILFKKIKSKSERNWIVCFCLAFSGIASFFGVQTYQELIQQKAWTAAAITIPLNAVVSFFAAILGSTLAWGLFAKSKQPKHWVVGFLSLLTAIYVPIKIHSNREFQKELEQIRTQSLAPQECSKRADEYQLLKDKVTERLRALVYNPSCDSETLVRLSDSSDESTLAAIASNPHTPVSILEKLSRHSSISVRYYLCFQPHLPKEILDRLAQDPDHTVSNRAKALLSQQTKSD